MWKYFWGAKITYRFDTKKNETVKEFTERIKKRKDCDLDLLLKEIYAQINYSKELEQSLNGLGDKYQDLKDEIQQKNNENEEMKQKLEKWKAMYTGQCEANKILILRSQKDD